VHKTSPDDEARKSKGDEGYHHTAVVEGAPVPIFSEGNGVSLVFAGK